MGKKRAKNRRKNGSGVLKPGGSPSNLAQPPSEHASGAQIPALTKLSDPSASERQWACHSLLYLMEEKECRERLVRGRAIRKVTPLLTDQNLGVREAAASLLRNLTTMDDQILNEQVAHSDVMTVLTAMLVDSLSQYQDNSGGSKVPSQPLDSSVVAACNMESCCLDQDEGEGEGDRVVALGRKERESKKQQLSDVLCQGIHLLKIMSEINPAIVDVFHQDNLVVVMKLLGLFHKSLEVAVAAAQLMLTVVEDNVASTESILMCSEHTALLCGIVTLQAPSDNKGLWWLLKASSAGILCHLLPHIKSDAEYFKLLEVILSSHVTVLDVTSTPQQLEEMLNLFKAKQVTMETITNMTYTEEEKCDVEEEGADVSEDSEGMEVDTSVVVTPPILKSITDASIHEKIWKTVLSLTGSDASSVNPISREDKELRQAVSQSATSLLMCSLCAIQNLISVLPVDQWSDGLASMWSVLFALLEQVPDPGVVSGVLVSLLHKTASAMCVTVEQVELSVKYLASSESPVVRRDMVVILCEVAKLQLSSEQESQLLNQIGSVLRDCISQDSSLLVMCEALDGVFDIFGDDRCPLHLFTSLSLMTTLEQCRANFKARFQVEKIFLEQHMELVQVVRTNLPQFIDYIKSKSAQHH